MFPPLPHFPVFARSRENTACCFANHHPLLLPWLMVFFCFTTLPPILFIYQHCRDPIA